MFPSPRSQSSELGTHLHGLLQSQGLMIRNNNGTGYGNYNPPSTTFVFNAPGSYNISIRHQMILPETGMASTSGQADYFRQRTAQRGMANYDGSEESSSSSSSPWIYPRTPSPSPSPRGSAQLTLFEQSRRAGSSSVSPQSSNSSSSQSSMTNEVEMRDGSGGTIVGAAEAIPSPSSMEYSTESLLQQPVPYYAAASLGSPGSQIPDVYPQWRPPFFGQR